MDHERWSLEHEGRLHEVFVRRDRMRLTAEWFVDGELVGSGSEWGEDTVVVSPDGPDQILGAVGVKGPKHFSATRRVVLHPSDTETPVMPADDADDDDKADPDVFPRGIPASASLLLSFDRGTLDLAPDPGTKAARRQDWILRHPRLHVVRETFSAGGAVLWGVIFFAVVVPVLEQLVPRIPWPALPSIPWPSLPDLPSIPWPDISLPSIPWPDLPELPSIPWPELPDWLGTALKLLFAVAVAGVVASSEVKRRREREHRAAQKPTPTGPTPTPSSVDVRTSDESGAGRRLESGEVSGHDGLDTSDPDTSGPDAAATGTVGQ